MTLLVFLFLFALGVFLYGTRDEWFLYWPVNGEHVFPYVVYYKYNYELKLHEFECPDLDYKTTVSDVYTISNAWEQVKERMDQGLF